MTVLSLVRSRQLLSLQRSNKRLLASSLSRGDLILQRHIPHTRGLPNRRHHSRRLNRLLGTSPLREGIRIRLNVLRRPRRGSSKKISRNAGSVRDLSESLRTGQISDLGTQPLRLLSTLLLLALIAVLELAHTLTRSSKLLLGSLTSITLSIQRLDPASTKRLHSFDRRGLHCLNLNGWLNFYSLFRHASLS